MKLKKAPHWGKAQNICSPEDIQSPTVVTHCRDSAVNSAVIRPPSGKESAGHVTNTNSPCRIFAANTIAFKACSSYRYLLANMSCVVGCGLCLF